MQNGAGDNRTAAPGIVFQYIRLEPARFDMITRTLITFSVPQSWQDGNRLAQGSIVLYQQTADGWVPLPTTFLYAKDGTAFSAESPGFSLFAIAGSPAPATPAVTAAPTASGGPVQELPPVTLVATR